MSADGELLAELLEESGLKIQFGLEAQGHIPTIEALLADGADWEAIGKAIGWHGPTARQYWERHLARTVTP